MNPTWLYVGVVYALAIWLARRGGVVIPGRVATFFYALVLIFMWKPLTGGWVNIPIDIVHSLPPWNKVAHIRGSLNSQMNDIVLQIVPWAHQSREALKSFTLPLWNSMTGCGYPLLANGQSAPFSIVRLLALPLPLAWAVTAEAAFKLLVAMVFTYLFARRRTYGELPSAIGAVAFGFSTFVHVWLHFPLGTAAAFIPAAIYSVDLLAEKITYRRFVFTAVLWAVMLYNGHPETVSHAGFLCAIYLLWIWIVERGTTFQRLAGIAAALACGALLAMPFIAPFLEAIPRSKRYQQLLVMPHVIGIFSDWPSKILLLEPTFFGHVPLEKAWVGAASAEGLEGACGILAAAAMIALAIRAIASRRFRDREFFFVLATIFFIGVVLGWPVISTIFTAIFKLAANARLRSMLCFLGAIQTAAALDFVRRERAWPYLIGILAAATTLFLFITQITFPGEYAKSGSVMAIWPSMIVLALAALVPVAGRFKHAATMLVAVAVVFELFSFNYGWNPNEPIELFYPKTPLLEKMEELKATHAANDPFRIAGIGPVFFPNLNAMYGLEDVRVHDPMANGRYLGVLRVRGDYDPMNYFAKWEKIDSRMLDFLNVRYLITDTFEEISDRQRYVEVYNGKDGRIFENQDAMPRFFTVPNVVLEFRRQAFAELITKQKEFRDTAIVDKLPVKADRERNDLLAPRPAGAPQATLVLADSTPTDFHMHVSAPRYTMIASSTPSWPGWHVEANGRSLRPLEVNGAFLGFVAPPGESDVRVWYAPWSFRIGVIVMMLTIAGLIAPRVILRREDAEGPVT
ncbi:MAG TPA: YfhO family protein [Thermoanaerobaculia bacterium]|nr:YfhO family protein [Thermoanaerobaculia bacterium]